MVNWYLCFCISWRAFGWVNFGGPNVNGLAYAEPGDVIAIDKGGFPQNGNFEHAMVVTEVTGTSGSRTVANIKVCAHNPYGTLVNQPLVDYLPPYAANKYYSTCRISGGYYSVTQ